MSNHNKTENILLLCAKSLMSEGWADWENILLKEVYTSWWHVIFCLVYSLTFQLYNFQMFM